MKTFKIAGIEIKNRYVLAPMAGYSDYSLRKLSSDYGAGLVFSEMVSCESIVYNSKATLFDLHMTKLDKENCLSKLALQIFGGKKEHILKSIPIIEQEANYDFLDFNCGCPVNKVVKQNAGSKWLTRLDELYDLIKDLVKISKKPLTIKMRTGFNEEIDLVSVAKNLENLGIRAITIHGRTRKEFFSGEVNYNLIRKVKENVSIPIIANGNISLENIEEVEKITKADAFMIGQKAMGNPRIFKNLILKEEKKKIKEGNYLDNIKDLKKHLELIYSYLDEKKASDIFRGVSTHYVKYFPNSSKLRANLVKCKSKKEFLDTIKTFIN